MQILLWIHKLEAVPGLTVAGLPPTQRPNAKYQPQSATVDCILSDAAMRAC